jgi:hypothetical protein
MKYYILFAQFVMLLFLIACSENSSISNETPTISTDHLTLELEKLSEDDMETIVIEGCEYLVYRHAEGTKGYGFMAHKGNCKNSIHIYRTKEGVSDSLEVEK